MNSDAPAVSERPWPKASSAWWLVALLTLAGVFSVIDRAILNIVVDPVRQDLGITDVQIGLLQGLAFGLFYALMGLPMGLLADRKSRKVIVVAGITLWSLATVWSGFAQNFGQLFAARLLVGLGEAALGPCAISMIADIFAPDRRGRPISIYMMGQGLANGLSISITGLLLALAMAGGFAFLPLLADLAPWRNAFIICGAGGLIVALALSFTTEPERRNVPLANSADKSTAATLPGVEEFRFLKRNAGVLVPLYLGFAVAFFVAYGAASWAPAMLMRGFNVSPGLLASILGPLTMGFTVFGPLLAGQLVDWSMRKGLYEARFTILAISPLLAFPAVFAVLAPSPTIAMILVASSSAAFALCGTVMFATLQALVPPQMRGISISLTLILNTLIGAALGPLFVAMYTERVLQDSTAVGWSIAAVCTPALICASLLFFLAGRAMKKALRMETEIARNLTGNAGQRAS